MCKKCVNKCIVCGKKCFGKRCEVCYAKGRHSHLAMVNSRRRYYKKKKEKNNE